MTGEVNGRELYETCRREGTPEQAAAFQTLGRYLYRVAWHLVSSRPALHDLPEEATQEALVTIWQNLSTLEDPDRFLPWASRVVVNKLYDALRRLGITTEEESPAASGQPGVGGSRRRRIPPSLTESLDAAWREEGGPVALPADAAAAEGEAIYANKERRQWLLETIAHHPNLSDNSKLVLLRGYLWDWDDGQLAALLNTPRSNVHTIRSRDLAALRADETFHRRLRDYLGE